MRPAADPDAPRCGALGPAEAKALVAGLSATMRDLEAVLAHETHHLSAGRLREGLAGQPRKTELAAAYLRGLETVKANVVALARHAPGGVETLKVAQRQLQAAVTRNQAVIETACALSEGLVRSLAQDVAQQSRPKSYGTARPVASRASPLVFSARL